ncbi:MAINTENANCE OF MERISTEMS [Hibiscus trionum]|uniref:MAINTENANCE OF MERISTEMS n=1 Tax=Hibiscus trionum TaxID=183268 RepID=A0A9W7HLE1_HIBTR|nr:MAINTENANCE OF MERISTEMS [Hibiscus trionum]
MTIRKIYDFAQNLLPKHYNFHPEVVKKLERTGFENLIKPTKVANHCIPFLSALVKRYNNKNKCFEFGVNNFIQLFIGLGDVLRITGLPIDGEPVIVDERKIVPSALCSRCLGNTDMLVNDVDISLPLLKEQFGKFKPDHVFENIDFHVRAAVIYILGSVVVPSSSSTVPSLYLTFLEDIKKIGNYAWGAAMLTHLYYSMDKIDDVKSGISGNFHFVSMFIFEHIPCVVSQLLHHGRGIIPAEGDNDDLPKEFPLMVEWHKKMVKKFKDSRNPFRESTFTVYFDELLEDKVERKPYARLQRDFLPSPYDGQIGLEHSLTSIICVEKRILHDPGVVMNKKLDKSNWLQVRKMKLKKTSPYKI